tara:strand:- start:10948 stop:11301 length:354 start_codon:yes stop_codon:yes gene_type:complete
MAEKSPNEGSESEAPNATGDWLLVEHIEEPTTKGGLALPDQSKYQGQARVVSVGPGPISLHGTRIPPDMYPGDVVWLGAPTQKRIEWGGGVLHGVRQADVVAVAGRSNREVRVREVI